MLVAALPERSRRVLLAAPLELLDNRLCVMCGRRRAVFRYRGVVKADATHTLCFQCYRSLRDSMRAQLLASMASGFMSVLFRTGVR